MKTELTANQQRIPTRREIYDAVCNMQTRVEDGYYNNLGANEALDDALNVLYLVQTYWETVITAEETQGFTTLGA